MMNRVIKSDKVNKDIYAKLYSDLHYMPEDDMSFLQKRIDKIECDIPDYIFFLGDLIDDSKYTKEDLKKLYDVVYKMSKLSKMIMVLGNHDQLTRDNNEWKPFYNEEYINELKNIGVNILQNEFYKDDNIFVYGTKFSGHYYENREPVEEFRKHINLAQFDTNRFNILMEHSPKYTFDTDVVKSHQNLDNVDLTLAGHYHNGCVPWYMDKILPGNFGLVDPYMNILPDNARGIKKITDTNLGIISAPITTFNKLGRLNLAKFLYFPTEQNILIKKR